MERLTLYANEQLDSICEYRYNQFVKHSDALLMHKHDFYELIFLSSNSQKHYVNGSVFELPRHTLLFIRPDDYHDLYNEKNDDAVIHHIAFTKAMAESLFSFLTPQFPNQELLSAKYSPYTILDSVESKYLESLFNSLNVIQFDDKVTKNIAMRSVLVQIFSKFFFTSRRTETDKIPLWLLNTCSAMSNPNNFADGVDKMAAISGKTREHLCRSMKKHYNLTASDFINDMRLTYIANRLVNSDIPIIDLCYESGFSNLGWMYTLFKKKYGESPAVFRKKA